MPNCPFGSETAEKLASCDVPRAPPPPPPPLAPGKSRVKRTEVTQDNSVALSLGYKWGDFTTAFRALITLLIATHEPSSEVTREALPFRVTGFRVQGLGFRVTYMNHRMRSGAFSDACSHDGKGLGFSPW